MVRKTLRFGCLLAAMFLAASGSAFAQRQPVPLRPRAATPPAARVQPTPQQRRMLDLPPRWVERLQEMTPAEQEKFLSNNARFRNLPAERQAQIRRRLQAWNDLTPAQRRTVIERQRIWQQMTPEQQRQVRETLLPAWRNLPPARRRLLLQRLHDLRDLGSSERADKLNDESFLAGLSSDERQMLRELSNLRITDQEGPGDLVPAPAP